MTNEQLVLRIQGGENVAENMLALWKQNKGLICSVARRYQLKNDYEDLCQQGYIGLDKAVSMYDPDGGASFAGYALFWIRNVIQRYVYAACYHVNCPERVCLNILKYRRTIAEFNALYGRDPSDRELCAALEIKPAQLEEIIKADGMRQPASLNSKPANAENESNMLQDVVPDPRSLEEDQADSLFMEELAADLWAAVDQLKPDERQTILAYYQEGRTVPEICRITGRPVKDIRRARTNALARLGRGKTGLRLSGYMEVLIGSSPGWAYSSGIRGTGVKAFIRTGTSATERAAIYG